MTALLTLLKLENIKIYLIVFAVIGAVIYYKDAEFQKKENKRQSENIHQIRKLDSFHYASQTYTKKELDEYLEYKRKDLLQFLEENKVQTRRIERIITQELKYRDTLNKNVNLQPVLDAIKNQREIKIPVVDSTDCLIVKGFVAFENDTLSLNITDRQFKNTSDVVTYWERNKWSFLGLWNWRLFGKKKATVIINDDCGNTKTFVIDKKN